MTEMNKKQEKGKYSLLSNVLYFHRYLYREKPGMALYHGVSVIVRCLVPLLGILMPGLVLAMAEQGDLPGGIAVISVAGLGMIVCEALCQALNHKIYFQENVFRTEILGDMVLKELRCLYKYVEYDEQKKYTRRAFQVMEGGDWTLVYRMLDDPRDLAVNIICFLLYSTVLSTLKPWMVAPLIGLSLADYGIFQIRNRWQLAFRDQFVQSDREIGYVQHSFRDAGIAKDIRIFSINEWLMAFRKKIFRERIRMEKRRNRKMSLAECLQILVHLLRNGFAYGYLLYACLQGDIQVSAFPVYLGAITGFSGFVTNIVEKYSGLRLANQDACCVRSHMDLREIGEKDREAPEALFRQPAEIVFEDVCFSYGEDKLYDHFNLTIHPGEKIAILGVNGAGKSTLVKLLCGLYEPDSGVIRINGVDIRTVPKRTLYDLFSVVFQEATVFPYPVGCNLSMRRLEDTDEERAWEALRRADLEETFREKGIRLEDFMTSQAFQGVELSGGQTQKLFLARALYKDGNILILDEPTSALDPVAESGIYQKYVEISRGRTSLFISHRLASTKFSDRILYLENGRVTEDGTHDALMALGGSYARMYEVQSHYYKE